MKISSPPGLHYPITIQELHKARNADVKRSDRLFTYYYESTVTEGDKWGGEKTVQKRFPTRFDASTEGKITRWFVKTGTVVQRPGVELLEIEEPCTHETQFGGLCADCGLDMTKVDYLTKERNVDRATVNMTHDNIALLVSHKEAVRAEEDTKKRLLGAKKLILIVDLDQTVIHTTCEKTIAEWQADPDNPNYDAVKDVQGFQLADDNVSNVAANWYYVKMRPGLKDFFDRMSKLYEMHVYTMATRAYAQAVAKIVDPDRKYFGDRILSRDENYTDKLKSLQRLFYQQTAMVVIIDDRADVWQYSPHLVRVPVFNFFPGAGDINASFLPKQLELVTSAKAKPNPEKTEVSTSNAASATDKPADSAPEEAANGTLNELEAQLITSMAVGESLETLQEQAKEQEKVIIAQQTERPLLQKQLMLDKKDEATDDNSIMHEVENGHAEFAEPHVRHSVLNNDDRGLDVIEANLRRVHRTFYDEYVKSKAVPAGGRIAELRGESGPNRRALNDVIPHCGELMPRIKQEVLDGAVVVFSGIIPLGVDIQTSDFALWIKSFGAEVSTNVTRRTTHVIANPERKTTKVKKAAHYPHIKIVNPEWMFQCCTRWERVDETPYTIEVDPAERSNSPFEDLDDDATGEEDADSPVTLALTADNWASLDDELADFLNESDTEAEAEAEAEADGNSGSESDADSVRSDSSSGSQPTTNSSQTPGTSDKNPTKKKRKRTSTSVDASEGEDSDTTNQSTSRLQRRKKRTMERVTSLTNVVTAEKSSGLPSPEATGPEEMDKYGEGDAQREEEADDALEAELLAGFGSSDEDD